MKKTIAFITAITLFLGCGIFAAAEETVPEASEVSASFNTDAEYLTLYTGEACSLDVKYITGIEDKVLSWKTSNSTVVDLFGEEYSTKTVSAKASGVAEVSIENSSGNVQDKIYITVKPKKAETVESAIFELTNEAIPVNKKLLGIHMHTNPVDSEGTTLLKSNISFNCFRTGYNPSDGQSYSEYSDSFEERITQHNMTYIVNLSRFAKDSADELFEQVKEIYEIVSRHQENVYIEFGNEMYTADITCEEYVEKVKELYPMVNNYKENIYTSVPILGKYFDDMGSTWDDEMEKISDYFDAVVPHNYSNISSYNLCTQNVYMERIFASNFYYREANKWVAEKFPGKGIWVTEYGHLNAYLFYTATTEAERARVQTAKTTGVAIALGERLLDMLQDEKINFANYHAPNDTQGFGLVQEYNGKTDILPGYYVYKELGRIINESDTVYKTNALYTDTFVSQIASTFKFTDKNVKKAGAYCFGNDSGKYVIFVNRSKNKCRTSLAEYKLIPIWKYSSENVLGENYLTGTNHWFTAPDYVETPTILDGDTQSSVVLDGYSMTVCRLAGQSPEVVCAFDVADGEENVLPNREFTVTFNTEILPENAAISLKCGGNEILAQIERISDYSYRIKPSEDLKDGAVYTLSADGGEVSFRTAGDENSYGIFLYQKIGDKEIQVDGTVCGETYLKMSNPPQSGNAYIASYDENGGLDFVSELSFDSENSFYISDKHYYKVFFFENLQTIKPFCAAYSINQRGV